MCFAYETAIESPKGPRPIEDYAVGDGVMAASAASGGWAWAAASVAFSSGTGPDSQQAAMVFIHYGDGEALIVTPDQPLLIGGGKLKLADQLVPGQDSLVGADGSAKPVVAVSIGHFAGGIHQIATAIGGAMDWDGSLDGHLLGAAGVICGDFVLQVRHGDPRMARYLADPSAPGIGTEEYPQRHEPLSES